MAAGRAEVGWGWMDGIGQDGMGWGMGWDGSWLRVIGGWWLVVGSFGG